MRAERVPTVLFVATPHALGGSNRSLITVLAQLEGRVNRVLAAPDFGAFVEYVRGHGLAEEFIGLPRHSNSSLDRVMRAVAGFKIGLWSIRNRARLDAIHANALTGLNLAALASLMSRRQTVLWIHDPVGSRWGARLGPVLRRLLPRLRIAAVSRTAEGVAVENGLCRAGDAIVVPNPIEPEEVLALQRRAPGATIHVGYVGGSTIRKGFDLLPDAISATLDLPISWKLFVYLEPMAENQSVWTRLDAFDGDRVDRVGKLADIRKVYADLDIVFIPSRAESFCRVAAEAMLNGIPVVGSDIDPLQALLGNDEAGLIFPSEDVPAAVVALRTLVQDAGLRETLGREGRARAAKFSPDAIADHLCKLYGIAV